jgi:hypothetical protein
MCLYPRLGINKKYIPNKKNNYCAPKIKDQRTLKVPIGCGKCVECKKQKARGWQVRLNEDIRKNDNVYFQTYTFSEIELQKIDNGISGLKGYDRENEACRIAVRRFTERWRKKYKKALRHWLVTELGHKGTERIHLHGLIWLENKPCNPRERNYKIYSKEFKEGKRYRKLNWYEYNREQIKDIGGQGKRGSKENKGKWDYGYVYKGDYVNDQTIGYIVKYINKIDPVHKEYQERMFVSKGIGRGYMLRNDSKRNIFKGERSIETYKTRSGLELALPIYYRNYIYNEEEREKLWLQKLDKEERWVCGVRVDVSDGMDEYYKLLEEKRKENKRDGYGNDEINWSLRRYENARRSLKRAERIEKLYSNEKDPEKAERLKAQAEEQRRRVSILKAMLSNEK